MLTERGFEGCWTESKPGQGGSCFRPVIIVDGGVRCLFQLFGEVFQEGAPFGGGAEAGNEVRLHSSSGKIKAEAEVSMPMPFRGITPAMTPFPRALPFNQNRLPLPI